MNKEKIKLQKRNRRRAKIRARIEGTKDCPRFSVHRSNKNIFAQLIDDNTGETLVSAHTREIKAGLKAKKTNEKSENQYIIETELGKLVAKKAGAKKIKQAVFDRGGYKYHGRIKAVADGARAGGLNF